MNVTRIFLLLAIAMVWTGGALAAPQFSVIDVGFLSDGKQETVAIDLNDKGTLLGYSGGQSVVWTPVTGLREVKDGALRDFSPKAINNKGATAGVMSYEGESRYDPMIVTRSGSRVKFLDGTWADDPNYRGIAQINDGGAVLGNSEVPETGIFRSWVWDPSEGLRFLPVRQSEDFLAQRMNDRGQIVGYAYVFGPGGCSGSRPFLYDIGLKSRRWLDDNAGFDTACGSGSAYDINNNGQIVGGGRTNDGAVGEPRAMMWTAAGGAFPLSGQDHLDVTATYAFRINERGQVVGTLQYRDRAKISFFYWDAKEGLIDLQQLIDPADPLAGRVVLESNGYPPLINEDGWIVVSGLLTEEGQIGPARARQPNRTFVLVPKR